MKDLTCPVQLVMTCGHIKEGQSEARCPVQWHCTVALYSGIVQWHCTVEGVWVCLVTFTVSPVLGGRVTCSGQTIATSTGRSRHYHQPSEIGLLIIIVMRLMMHL